LLGVSALQKDAQDQPHLDQPQCIPLFASLENAPVWIINNSTTAFAGTAAPIYKTPMCLLPEFKEQNLWGQLGLVQIPLSLLSKQSWDVSVSPSRLRLPSRKVSAPCTLEGSSGAVQVQPALGLGTQQALREAQALLLPLNNSANTMG
jgi:hypothetical protein